MKNLYCTQQFGSLYFVMSGLVRFGLVHGLIQSTCCGVAYTCGTLARNGTLKHMTEYEKPNSVVLLNRLSWEAESMFVFVSRRETTLTLPDLTPLRN